MKTFFPNFEEVFGHSNLKIVLQSQTAPLVTITEELTQVKMGAFIKFLNPYDENYEVIEIKVDLVADMTIELLYDFTVSGKVNKLIMNVTDLKTYFKTNVKPKDLGIKVHAMESPFVTAINT